MCFLDRIDINKKKWLLSLWQMNAAIYKQGFDMTNIQNIPNKDNSKEETFSLSYTIGIPTVLVEDKNLSDRQFRLMIHLIGLARKEGYCWASDKYLAEKMKISISQIKREIQTLEKNEYIIRKTVRKGMKSERSIYVTPAFSKKSYESSPVSLPDAHPRASGMVTGELPIYKESNIINKKRESPNFESSDAPAAFSKFSKEMGIACEKLLDHVFSLKVKTYDPRNSVTTWYNWLDCMRKIIEIDKRSLSEITEMIDYIHDDDFWDINVRSPQKLREKWTEIELQKKKAIAKIAKEDREFENEMYAQEIEKTLRKNGIPKEVMIHVNSSYIEIGMKSHPTARIIKFTEKAFKGMVWNTLRKMGLLQYLDKQN